MASNRLSNYLRTHRKRLGLSQEEVAHLLGAESGAKVCRYEKFARMPGLETALACEIIFKKPVRELFAGLYQKVERKVALRATKQLRRSGDKQQTARVRHLLEDLAAQSDNKKES